MTRYSCPADSIQVETVVFFVFFLYSTSAVTSADARVSRQRHALLLFYGCDSHGKQKPNRPEIISFNNNKSQQKNKSQQLHLGPL